MQEVIEDMPRPIKIKIKIKINCHLGFPVYPTSLSAQAVHPRLRVLREARLLCLWLRVGGGGASVLRRLEPSIGRREMSRCFQVSKGKDQPISVPHQDGWAIFWRCNRTPSLRGAARAACPPQLLAPALGDERGELSVDGHSIWFPG